MLPRGKMPKKLRLDQLLVGNGLFASREQARRAIMAGDIMVGTRTAAKPSELLEEETTIIVKPTRKYVGRRAWNLEAALDHFHINIGKKTVVDIGAPTGGIPDGMMQRAAENAIAVDPGH